MGMPEGEEEQQETEKLLEKITKENFPNLAKERDKSRKHRVPNNLDPKRTTPKHIIIKTPKVKEKEKERTLNAAREK